MVRDVKITVLDTTGVRTNSWTLLFGFVKKSVYLIFYSRF